MRLLSLVVIFFLCSSISWAYNIDYRSVPKEDQKIYDIMVKSIDKKYFVGVNKIIVYNREMWVKWDGIYFAGNGIILIDKSGLYSFEYTLKHELSHHKCWKENKDVSHGSQCFTNGLD